MNVLILAADHRSSYFLCSLLEENGHHAESVLTSRPDLPSKKAPDLILAELSRNDYNLLLQIQNLRWSAPIIILSDELQAADRVFCIERGAVYFLCRRFETNELLAYITSLQKQHLGHTESLRYGNTVLELDSCQLVCGSKSVRLSAREFHVMHILLQARERITSKQELLTRVWGADSVAVENHVEVYVGFLRKKLRSIDSNIIISTARRMGYHLDIFRG